MYSGVQGNLENSGKFSPNKRTRLEGRRRTIFRGQIEKIIGNHGLLESVKKT
jgi:hypothetical protein